MEKYLFERERERERERGRDDIPLALATEIKQNKAKEMDKKGKRYGYYHHYEMLYGSTILHNSYYKKRVTFEDQNQ